MSYTEIMAVQKSGRVVGVEELRNSHLFGPIVWSKLYEKYFRPWDFRLESDEYDARKARGEDVGEFDHGGHRRSWALYKDPRTEEHDWAAMASTFDNFVCPREHMSYLVGQLAKFGAWLPQSHFIRVADAVARLYRDGHHGVCFYGTSIIENPWTVRDPKRDRWRAYNVKRDAKHWFFDPAEYPGRKSVAAAAEASP